MNLSAFSKLHRRQYYWLFLAYWRLWLVQIKLKFAGSTWLAKQLHFGQVDDKVSEEAKTAPKISDGQLTVAKQMHESVRLAARCHLWQAACLPRSIVLADMLNAGYGESGQSATNAFHLGKPARVRVGVQQVLTDKPHFASHAWVELRGEMVAEPASLTGQFKKVLSQRSL